MHWIFFYFKPDKSLSNIDWKPPSKQNHFNYAIVIIFYFIIIIYCLLNSNYCVLPTNNYFFFLNSLCVLPNINRKYRPSIPLTYLSTAFFSYFLKTCLITAQTHPISWKHAYTYAQTHPISWKHAYICTNTPYFLSIIIYPSNVEVDKG